jgi:hypothetical protein
LLKCPREITIIAPENASMHPLSLNIVIRSMPIIETTTIVQMKDVVPMSAMLFADVKNADLKNNML